MPLRLVQAVLPPDAQRSIDDLAGQLEPDRLWTRTLDDDRRALSLLVEADRAEEITDALAAAHGAAPGFRLVVLPVEATLPRIDPDQDDAPSPKRFGTARISRDELLEDVAAGARLTPVFLAMVALSAIVAAVGLIRDQAAVVIGAMVIAPLLGPNVALSLATILGDVPLLRRALRVNLVGIAVAVALGLLLGLLLDLDPRTPQLALRSQVGLSDLALALASGAAGTLAFTSGLPATLVGVMVAVALLPPTMAFGLLAGAGHLRDAGHAATLLLANIICVNLAGTLTFALTGVRPRTWWEAGRARRSTIRAVVLWLLLLAGLIALLMLGPTPEPIAPAPPEPLP